MAQSILEESKKARGGFFRFIFKKKFIIIAILILAIGGGTYYYVSKKKQTSAAVVTQKQYTVKKEDLRISVSATGKVVAKDGVELSFPVSGNLEVDNVYTKEGDKIKKGDKIASVKTESLAFELRSAYNNYQSALASYNTKLATATESEKSKAKASIEQAQVSLDQAKISLEQTKSNSAQSITNAETNVTTAESNLKLNNTINDSEIVHNSYLSLTNTLKTIDLNLGKLLRDSDSIVGVDDTNVNSEYRLGLGALNSTSLSSAKASYIKVKSLRTQFDAQVNSLNDNSANSTIDSVANTADQVISAMQNHERDMQELLDSSITFTGMSQTKLDGFKSMINSNQSSAISMATSLNSATQGVDNAKSSLSSYQTAYNKAVNDLKTIKSQAEQNINNSTISVKAREISLAQAKNDYTDLLAPISENDLASARAQLTSAAISVDRAKYNMEQATLIAPIDGIVSMLNYKKGDIILDSSTSKTVATIINNDTLYIEVNVEEADISKLKVGEKAAVTFDAVDGVNLTGEISFISLTSTTSSNGIVTYLVRVILSNTGASQIREGMTAALEFITSEAPGVIAVPVQAVRNIGGKPSVVMLDGSVRNVVTNFTDGKKAEVVGGLQEGEVIVY
ncbi:MAG: efflux RND transporter periplasmic adaptor subunit [Candidatus Falkowbacteria bacterium]